MNSETPENEYQQFCDDPTCRDCDGSMELSDGCEWPEDPEFWLCSGCICSLAIKFRDERNAALSRLAVVEETLTEETRSKNVAVNKWVGRLDESQANLKLAVEALERIYEDGDNDASRRAYDALTKINH